MSRPNTVILSGSIALAVGAVAFPGVLVVMIAGAGRLGFGSPNAFLLVVEIGIASLLAYEAFRRTFNALCERWSDDVDPPHIRSLRHHLRYRSTIVRTLR